MGWTNEWDTSSNEWGKPNILKCKAFANCIQPHICNPTNACIWGQESNSWNKGNLVEPNKPATYNYLTNEPPLPINRVVLASGKEFKTIRVRFNNIVREVTVEVVGDLGLEWDNDGWEMYHLPTLTQFSKAVPKNHIATSGSVTWADYTYDREPLLNWMKKVQEGFNEGWITSIEEREAINDAWGELRKLTPNDYRDNAMQAKEIIQKWCLSVKVK